tara:strand:+ start:854 stop:1042 length:189 start_codon:yes stop_codon:yes gene_type:complete
MEIHIVETVGLVGITKYLMSAIPCIKGEGVTYKKKQTIGEVISEVVYVIVLTLLLLFGLNII